MLNHWSRFGGCIFILLTLFLGAAAAGNGPYNNRPSTEVRELSYFRDRHLLTHPLGRRFVEYYYTHGPAAAVAISDKDRLRALVRFSLLPLMYAGKNMYLLRAGFRSILLFLIVYLGYVRIYGRYQAACRK